MACGGMIFIKNFQILEKKIHFFYIYFFLSLLLMKPQKAVGTSRASPDTSSLVVNKTQKFKVDSYVKLLII